MIKIKNLNKKYMIGGQPFYALDGVTTEINCGEMVAIKGRSGAGKSTLLNILGCLDTFDQGTYILDGEIIRSESENNLAKIRNEKIGFVLQNFSLINHRTALYNVSAPMLFNKTPLFSMKKRALEALEVTGVKSQANKNVENMSGGQQQRVAIARAIVNNPAIILADEPTGNLDTVTSKEIMDLFVTLNKSGKTIIIVTHDDTVASYCSRIITISDGKIISDTN